MFPLFMSFLTEKSSNCLVQHFQTFHNFQNCLLLTYKIKNCCRMKIACKVVFSLEFIVIEEKKRWERIFVKSCFGYRRNWFLANKKIKSVHRK